MCCDCLKDIIRCASHLAFLTATQANPKLLFIVFTPYNPFTLPLQRDYNCFEKDLVQNSCVRGKFSSGKNLI